MENQGIYYFHQGTNYRSYELLGAHYTKEGTVFRVFAPNAVKVSVVGEFNGWDSLVNQMYKISNEGIWEAYVPNAKEFDCYQYLIQTKKNKFIYQ